MVNVIDFLRLVQILCGVFKNLLDLYLTTKHNYSLFIEFNYFNFILIKNTITFFSTFCRWDVLIESSSKPNISLFKQWTVVSNLNGCYEGRWQKINFCNVVKEFLCEIHFQIILKDIRTKKDNFIDTLP